MYTYMYNLSLKDYFVLWRDYFMSGSKTLYNKLESTSNEDLRFVWSQMHRVWNKVTWLRDSIWYLIREILHVTSLDRQTLKIYMVIQKKKTKKIAKMSF